jgi:pyruvate, water dikinase
MPMLLWRRKNDLPVTASSAEARLRRKYLSFRNLLVLNNDCLELMSAVQEDLQYVPPYRELFSGRVAGIFEKAAEIVASLEALRGGPERLLARMLGEQRREVESYLARQQELRPLRLSAWLSEVDLDSAAEVGGKAAALGEIRKRLGAPIPDGYVLTTEAYRRFCGIPLWQEIREALRGADLADLEGLQAISARLMARVLACPVQFLSLINVPATGAVDAYRRVVAERFGERALSYRLSAGLPEIASPMAVLFLPIIPARASGILYTRDPKQPKGDALWLTSTRGLGLDIASGRVPADWFVLSRKRPHAVLDQTIVRKEQEVVPVEGGGVTRRPLQAEEVASPSLEPEYLRTLAEWGVRIEKYFGVPQDIEWALDPSGKIWILQTRPLALAERTRAPARPRGEPRVTGGVTVYPGRVSGSAHLAADPPSLRQTPVGAILITRRASPEIVQVLPRIVGLAAEHGNITGHAATLLREFRVPSVFLMAGALEQVREGEAISLDAVQPSLYPGSLWPTAPVEFRLASRYREMAADPLSRRLLTLHLLDAGTWGFRPSGCQSAHDVLRYCHEKAVEAMFAVQDRELEHGPHRSKKLLASVPVNFFVLDLGGGLAQSDPEAREVTPQQIVCRPFQALWKGITHPAVSWTRKMPASFSDLASVMAGSLASQSSVIRALGERSYLLVAGEYMNLNSRLAYHFSLVDACLSDNPLHNYVAFRFAGGGATRERRNLRACFLEASLKHYGYVVDRRGDLVNAWFKKARSEETENSLDILGRLMASSSQLDMYMSSQEAMQWYVEQFLAGNYSFRDPRDEEAPLEQPRVP